jgi:hypothetical protein
MTQALTPPDCDLRDFPSMLLDHRRLLTSETWIEAAQMPRLGHALMSLWCESFQQVPAASLPDNDLTLLRLSMCPTPAEWKKVRGRALAGWVRCDDGRLYHPVVAEKALEAWLEKLASRLSSGAGNAKRWKIAFDPKPIEQQMQVARQMLTALNPQSRSLAKRRTAGVPATSITDPDGTPDDVPSGSQEKGSGREGTISEAKASGGKPPADADPAELIFGLGLPLLLAASVPEKSARSMLGLMRKMHGEEAVIHAVQRCADEKPLQPVEFLQGILRSRAKGAGKHAGFSEKDYREGIEADGSLV